MKTTRLPYEALVASQLSREAAEAIAALDLPEGEVGHLLCQPTVEAERVVLGYDSNVPLVVINGQVIALDGQDRIVNSSTHAYCLVVQRYAKYINDVVRAQSDDEGERIARTAADEMRDMDLPAFAVAEYYWPIICTQMIEGNL